MQTAVGEYSVSHINKIHEVRGGNWRGARLKETLYSNTHHLLGHSLLMYGRFRNRPLRLLITDRADKGLARMYSTCLSSNFVRL